MKKLKREDAITMVELINQLKRQSSTNEVLIDLGAGSIFNQGIMATGDLISYRGYYEDLAIEPALTKPIKVGAFIKQLEDQIGRVLVGYKGGEYYTQTDTKVWVSSYGHSSSNMVIGMRTEGPNTILELAEQEW